MTQYSGDWYFVQCMQRSRTISYPWEYYAFKLYGRMSESIRDEKLCFRGLIDNPFLPPFNFKLSEVN